LRRGKRNINIRSDIKKYKLISPSLKEFIIYQKFCKEEKLQLHVLKKYNNCIIGQSMVMGSRIFAKNTIGWILKD